MNHDIWNATYRLDRLPGLPGVNLMSVISADTDGPRRLVVRLAIEGHTPLVSTIAHAELTLAQIRALATLLTEHAERIERELVPLLNPAPEIAPVELYREPEAV